MSHYKSKDVDSRLDIELLSSYGLEPQRIARRMAFYYILFGCIWIAVTSYAVHSFNIDPDVVRFLELVKGWFFVGVSGAFIYVLVLHRMNIVDRALDAVYETAYYDSLTNLPNKQLLRERFKEMTAAGQKKAKLYIVSMDIDNFKHVNNNMGHVWGDHMLKQVACSLQTVCNNDLVARVGGDEFTLVITDSGKAELRRRIEEITELFDTPWLVDENPFYTSISMGVATYPDDATNIDTLQKKADTALAYAKAIGKNRCLHYKKTMDGVSQQFMTMGRELREALYNNELFVVYQPIVSTESGKLTGLEALTRWQHPTKGTLNGGRFIPYAEELGIVAEIDMWVMEQVVQQLQEWEQQHKVPIPVSVNLSSKTLSLLEDSELRSLFQRHSVNSSSIIIEITETAILDNISKAVAFLNYVKDLGFQIALDDFGTGFSSLTHLIQLPFDYIKLDRTFIGAIPAQDKQTAIINGIIGLVHDLGKKVIAEGVETAQQFDYLAALGCDQAQGYYFSKPVTITQLDSYSGEEPFLQ